MFLCFVSLSFAFFHFFLFVQTFALIAITWNDASCNVIPYSLDHYMLNIFFSAQYRLLPVSECIFFLFPALLRCYLIFFSSDDSNVIEQCHARFDRSIELLLITCSVKFSLMTSNMKIECDKFLIYFVPLFTFHSFNNVIAHRIEIRQTWWQRPIFLEIMRLMVQQLKDFNQERAH